MATSEPVRVTVFTQGGDEHSIEVPLDLICSDFVNELVMVLKLPVVDAEGCPIIWRIDNKDTGLTLENAKTLQENRVEEGHQLSLIRQVVAGGGPEIPFTIQDTDFWKAALRYQLIYALSGLALGLCCILGGIVLFLHGVAGSTSWTAKVVGAESDISDAAPGAIVFVVGFFMVWTTKFSPKIKK